MEQEERLRDWMEKYTNRLYRLAYTLTHSKAEADDRVQDGFIKAYYAMGTFDQLRDPFPWLAKIVINECKMAKRRSFREIVTNLLPERLSVSTEETVLRLATSNEMYEVILRLPVIMRIPIVLHYFEELSVQQIADITGVPTGTVKSRLARGRAKLNRSLKEAGVHDRPTDSECETIL
ncbi:MULTISPECIES: RNA polymerase sigma factor [Paenibacillus]|uniref:RNA polymerase, sigma-24 subunit, ECF subfamily n=1 Tax=Paenibacillus lactis 154 TaxID=743719 RepID=G4HJ94_9BACL|nr:MULTISPECIES: RNA polymerase sigma factor [Paenibacillus]EHB62812.1 RNA polymerase, sigma-24 subunit, ECF subfamily [Paenibacillus lactis 154]